MNIVIIIMCERSIIKFAPADNEFQPTSITHRPTMQVTKTVLLTRWKIRNYFVTTWFLKTADIAKCRNAHNNKVKVAINRTITTKQYPLTAQQDCIMLLKCVQLISPMFCPFNASFILASEKFSMWNQRTLCTNVKLSSECSQSLTLLT